MIRVTTGIITGEGNIKAWRVIGKEMTLHSYYSVRDMGIKSGENKCKVYLADSSIYICCGDYTSRFKTIDGLPVRIGGTNVMPVAGMFMMKSTKSVSTFNPSSVFYIYIDDSGEHIFFNVDSKSISDKDQKNFGRITVKRLPKYGVTIVNFGILNRKNNREIGFSHNKTGLVAFIKDGECTALYSKKYEVYTCVNIDGYLYIWERDSMSKMNTVYDTKSNLIYRMPNTVRPCTTHDDYPYIWAIRNDSTNFEYRFRKDTIETSIGRDGEVTAYDRMDGAPIGKEFSAKDKLL